MEYRTILLKTAISAIASDGVVDDREIEALYRIEKKSKYFASSDLEQLLKADLELCMANIDKYFTSTLDSISSESLNIAQELELLEISFRIIHADGILAIKEERFIKQLRAVLQVNDLVIAQRFGEIKSLGIAAPYEIIDNDENDEIIDIKDGK